MSSGPRFEVTSLGEMLLRLSVPPGVRLQTASRLDICPAGAETNTLAALARLGRRCGWVGGLPENPLGWFAANHLRMAGVDSTGIAWKDGRMGLFFVELSGPPRPSSVWYDRAGSCAAHMRSEDVDWEYLLSSRLLHLTGITPALSESCRELVGEAVRRAKAAAVPLSFDVNYREKLWSAADAKTVLEPLIRKADLLICGRPDAQRLFGCTGPPDEIVRQLREQTGATVVILTVGEEGALALDGEDIYREPAVPVQIIDRIGAGDALAAGVIHGWLEGNLARGLRYGVALAALALSQHGDMLVATPEDLQAVLGGSGSGVQR